MWNCFSFLVGVIPFNQCLILLLLFTVTFIMSHSNLTFLMKRNWGWSLGATTHNWVNTMAYVLTHLFYSKREENISERVTQCQVFTLESGASVFYLLSSHYGEETKPLNGLWDTWQLQPHLTIPTCPHGRILYKSGTWYETVICSFGKKAMLHRVDSGAGLKSKVKQGYFFCVCVGYDSKNGILRRFPTYYMRWDPR